VRRLALTLPLLALLAAGCGSAVRHLETGNLRLDSERLTGGWSLAQARLPERVDCVKWESRHAGGISCLPPGQLPVGTPSSIQSTRAGGGWSVAELGSALCLKWEEHHHMADLSCFKREGAYDGSPATIVSHKAGGGWSVAEVRVPGQQPRLCVKWQHYTSGKNAHGGGAFSCFVLRQPMPVDPQPQVTSQTIGDGGWSVGRMSFNGLPTVDCLKWQSRGAGGMSCFLEESRIRNPTLSTTNLGGGWSVHTLRIPGYPLRRCLKWSSSGAGGVSCLELKSAS
jgi:hypothetical protein